MKKIERWDVGGVETHLLALAASQQSIFVHTKASLFSRPGMPTLE